ncbi:MAG: preprotein translocase subunit SecY [Bacillota bacterium]|jgi:preprotein translocase subunit SecY
MLGVFINAWKVAEIRNKIIFTLLMFVIFRLGAHIPIPGIDTTVIQQLLSSSIFGFVDILSGGSLKQFTIFAMGVIPYINASIIINLLTMVVPYFEKLQKEGPEGRKKMMQITRYGTVLLGFAQALAMSFFLRNAFLDTSIGSVLLVALTLTTGTVFLMWLGELITDKGVGNGISLIIFAGIVASLPGQLSAIGQYVQTGEASIVTVILFVVMAIAVIAGIVAVQEGQRRVPVQYAKRVVGRKMYGGQSTYIPMKINQAGVIPIIFAMAILTLPGLLSNMASETNTVAAFIAKIFDYQHPVYMICYGLLILGFTYFYTAATFNVTDIADNLKKNGGFVPGLRPGKPTVDYLDKVLSRITFSGALFLAFIALLPSIAMGVTGLNFYFGGTSLLIAVGVALDTMKQIESQLLMRHYQGFMK